jgi:DNA-directed RNA polymerase specialized sigma24 family protein
MWMQAVGSCVSKRRGAALLLQKAMRASHPVRGRFVRDSMPGDGKTPSSMEQPGIFQLTLLRAYGLSKAYRDVFLLKEIQGYTLAEIAAILGISIDTALVRWQRARREIGHWDDSGAIEGAR